mmetsp:Transcript_156498/g.272306  ORF Transcript_156498/g.272306 Transcript_156498/m.272306 type:complete len:228 (-) Transcript_156498:372-1055(-)
MMTVTCGVFFCLWSRRTESLRTITSTPHFPHLKHPSLCFAQTMTLHCQRRGLAIGCLSRTAASVISSCSLVDISFTMMRLTCQNSLTMFVRSLNRPRSMLQVLRCWMAALRYRPQLQHRTSIGVSAATIRRRGSRSLLDAQAQLLHGVVGLRLRKRQLGAQQCRQKTSNGGLGRRRWMRRTHPSSAGSPVHSQTPHSMRWTGMSCLAMAMTLPTLLSQLMRQKLDGN